MTLKDKVAVVTGGGAGIGRAITLRLAGEGARVAVLDIRRQTADDSLELAGGDGVALACDVSDSSPSTWTAPSSAPEQPSDRWHRVEAARS